MVELLLDLSIIKVEHGNVVPEVRIVFFRSARTTSDFILLLPYYRCSII